jgi:hypothetical protein
MIPETVRCRPHRKIASADDTLLDTSRHAALDAGCRDSEVSMLVLA